MPIKLNLLPIARFVELERLDFAIITSGYDHVVLQSEGPDFRAAAQRRLANLASCCVDEKYVPVAAAGHNCVSCAVEGNASDAGNTAVDLQRAPDILSSLCIDEKELA